MITHLRSVRFQAMDRISTEMDEQIPCGRDLGRLIPLALALYLTPVLLIVLVVGGVGMVALAVARVVTALVKGPGSRPRTSGQTRSPLI